MNHFYGKKMSDELHKDDYFGDERLRPYLSYERDAENRYCIYCGRKADSREHLPSRIFLDKPYPENLDIAPACLRCNTGLSRDEQFVACLIEYWKSKISEEPIERVKILKTIERTPSLLKRITDMFNQNGSIKSEYEQEFIQRIKNIAAKLVIGHTLYDLSEFFEHHLCEEEKNNEKNLIIISDVNFAFINNLSDETIRKFNAPVETSVMPEIGSREFMNTLIQNEQDSFRYYWRVVQQNNYRYLASPETVRIVIRETLYIEGKPN